jgi:diguanylate cyclase (GGDEF)-like protein
MLKPLYSVLQVGPPIVYIIVVLLFTIRRVHRSQIPEEKRYLLSVGAFPLMVVIGGVAQVLSDSDTPIFCFSSTVLMIIFYIRAMEDQISADPLTGLNNRAQLSRYVAQDNTLRRDGKLTYVMMIDINDFKKINDTYGHSNGDKALVTIADALRKAMGKSGAPGFLGRFGGDEFIMIVHPQQPAEMEAIDKIVRECINEGIANSKLPFIIDVGIGYDRLIFEDGDSFPKCLERADMKLYENKAAVKAAR